MKRKILLLILHVWLCTTGYARHPLTLDSCKILAMKGNKELKIARKKILAAHYEHQAARTNYLPKFSATGSYLFNPKEVSLLNNRQKEALRNAGTHIQELAQEALSSLGATAATQATQVLGFPLEATLNAAGSALAEAFRTDTRHIWAGGVTVTQPIYTGGKIKAYDHLTRMAEEMAGWEEETVVQNLITETEKAYWQVVELSNKRSLAESFLQLTDTLNQYMERMIAAGMATQADGLSVKVRMNEAEMALTKAEHGLQLSRMALCLLCGIDLNTPLQLADEKMDSLTSVTSHSQQPDIHTALERRPELKALETACDICLKKINLVRAEYLPNIALMGGYLVSNPSLYNGFEKKFNGSWNIGVLINVPLFNWGEGLYKSKVAQTEADMMRYELEEAREEVSLQVAQAICRVNEAHKQLALSLKNVEKANENLRYASLAFQEGVATSVQVMEAQTAWQAAQSARIDAQISLKMSEVYLKQATGMCETIWN